MPTERGGTMLEETRQLYASGVIHVCTKSHTCTLPSVPTSAMPERSIPAYSLILHKGLRRPVVGTGNFAKLTRWEEM